MASRKFLSCRGRGAQLWKSHVKTTIHFSSSLLQFTTRPQLQITRPTRQKKRLFKPLGPTESEEVWIDFVQLVMYMIACLAPGMVNHIKSISKIERWVVEGTSEIMFNIPQLFSFTEDSDSTCHMSVIY